MGGRRGREGDGRERGERGSEREREREEAREEIGTEERLCWKREFWSSLSILSPTLATREILWKYPSSSSSSSSS